MTGRVKAEAPSVRCLCGRETRVEADAFGRLRSCPSCGGAFKAVWAIDPRSGRRVPVAVPQGELRSETPPALRIPAGAEELVCDCGQVLAVRPRHVGKTAHCPVCRRSMKLERYKDPETRETRVRRAGGSTAALSASELAAAAAQNGVQELLCSCGEYLSVTAQLAGKRVQCGGCAAIMRIEKGKDGAPLRAVLVGRGQAADSDSWSLEDFA